MKRVKKFLVLLLAVVMTMSVITVTDIGTTTVKAEDIFTITSPKAGDLKAAGLIDISWTDASSDGTVSNYSVFINGKLVTTTTALTYEYYTTKVNYHTVWIRANYADGKYAFTSSVRFGVSKKGLGLSSSMGSKLILKSEFNLSWYYNWSETPSAGSQYEDVEFVPMVWKSTSANDLSTRVANAKNKGYKYILTFNEPDLKGQCDMPVNDVYNAWKGLNGMEGIKISSPVTAQWPESSKNWFQPFMKKVDDNGDYKPDFISIHCYPDNYAGAGMAKWFVEDVVGWAWEKYGLPIWVTEFSTTGQYVKATATTEFWEAVMPLLDEKEYVERYAAFGFNAKDNPGYGLWYYSTGAQTEAGAMYAKMGNPTIDLVEGTAHNPGATQKGARVKDSGDVKQNATDTDKNTMNMPHKGKIKKLKNVTGKKVKLTIKKVPGATGYQIRYCDNKKFNGYETKNTTKKKITIKKLAKDTKYYFKVRAYVKTSSGKVYGKWSKAKKVKVTK